MTDPGTFLLAISVAALLGFLAGKIATKRKLSKLAKLEFEVASLAMCRVEPVAKFNFFPGSEQYRPVMHWLCKKYSAIDTIYIWHNDTEFEIYGAWTRAGRNEIDPYPLRMDFSKIEDPNEIVRMGKLLSDIGNEFKNKRKKEEGA